MSTILMPILTVLIVLTLLWNSLRYSYYLLAVEGNELIVKRHKKTLYVIWLPYLLLLFLIIPGFPDLAKHLTNAILFIGLIVVMIYNVVRKIDSQRESRNKNIIWKFKVAYCLALTLAWFALKVINYFQIKN